MKQISERRFQQLVAEALDELPEEWGEMLDNVAVVVEDEPTDDELESVGLDPHHGDELLGLYQGVPPGERGLAMVELPDRVAIYRGPILRVCRSRAEVLQQIRETVLHELGHHFGLQEDDLPF